MDNIKKKIEYLYHQTKSMIQTGQIELIVFPFLSVHCKIHIIALKENDSIAKISIIWMISIVADGT